MKLWEYIKSGMLKTPSQIVCENDASITFEELVIWVENFSKNLKDIKCCAVLCGSEMAASMAILSCFAAGVTALPLSMRYGELHCNKIIDTISPDAVITDEDGEFQIRRITDSTFVPQKNHPAVIMCTSGTTGIPKGVMLSEENIICNVKDICEYFAINRTDTILIARPLYHCAVLTGEFLTSLIKGVKICFSSFEFNPIKILEIINKYKITAFCATPTLLSLLTRFKRENVKTTLKHICISGECMEKETAKRISAAFPNTDVYHIYGLTEACPRVCYLPPELFSEYPDFVGVPLRSVSVKIVKKNGKKVRPDEEGILFVKGNNIMLGYYNEPQKTAKVLKNGWLCTGDIAIKNNNGLIKIKGRNDHLITKSGMNIYPAEVENAIKFDSRVSDVLVYGFKNSYGTQIGMKIVGDFSTVDEVKRLCLESLPSFQTPARIEIVDALPKNASGKIIRGDSNA